MIGIPNIASVIGGIVAAVLAFSGGAKLAHPGVAAAAMVRFGVVRRDRVWYARGVAAAELLLAFLLLVPDRTFLLATLTAASALLAVFVFLQIRALSRGESFACGCFGEGEDHPISVASVTRTAILLLASLTGTILAASAQLTFGIGYGTALAGLAALLVLRSLATIRRYGLFE